MAATGTEPLQAEYRAARQGCALIDRSERGRLALSGRGAVEFLNGQVTNELEGLVAGEGRYAAFLTHKGKMLGDLRILATSGPDGFIELLLDTERAALQALFDMIRRFKVGYEVELHKRTLQSGQISLLGPRASALALLDGGLSDQEHASRPAEIEDIPVLAVRTVSGLDLICAAAETDALIEVFKQRGAVPLGEQTAECLRIEQGIPRYGVDLDETVIPQEAGLNERAVSFTKGCYVGQETVARLFYKGKPNRHLRGLRLAAPAPPGTELRLGERVVGRLTSVADSPALGPIGLALVRREAEPGTKVELGGGGEALVTELPFALPGQA
jgi:folate-binding protein YgfZ